MFEEKHILERKRISDAMEFPTYVGMEEELTYSAKSACRHSGIAIPIGVGNLAKGLTRLNIIKMIRKARKL
ncbi:MAG: hypothetical protein J7K26_01575 [Candidatus Aenigmarchaeota archaeon]|nr:hypothetical protein [Candidatus Aenigmarchaeota archaeon]